MLDRTEDDLVAAFEEANNIDEVQTSHDALIRDVVLKNLKAGVSELEAKIDLYEFLNQDPRGFDNSIFSTFRESKEERTSRGDINASALFVDPRTKELLPLTADATVELVGERLTLATADKVFHTVYGIRQLFDSTSPQTDKIVTPPNMQLENIIDGQTGTYWCQSWLFQSLQKYVKAQIELDFGVVREINFIEIEPVTSLGFYLEALHYLDGSNVFQDLELSEQFLNGTVGLRIRKIATRRIILTFRNENGHATNFEYKTHDSLLNQSKEHERLPLTEYEMAGVSRDLAPLIPSEAIREMINVTQEEKSIYNGYEFTIGFDNIKVGLASYEPTSIYVSTPVESTSAAILGLRVLESRPYLDTNSLVQFTPTTYDTDDDIFFIGSIEYWITKQDLNVEGNLVRTTVFPILPLEVSRIHHERLLLTEKSLSTLAENNIGDLVFYTSWHRDGSGNPIPNEPDGDIVVYRNGIVLPNVDNIPLATEGWVSTLTTNADKVPDSGAPMRFRIKVIGGLVGDIYTVSYTPMVSTTSVIPKPPYDTLDYRGGLQVVDLVGDLSARRGEAQVIITEELSGSTIASSRYYCTILLRQNTAETSVSPAVEEYTLFTGSKDTTKFSGD